MTAHLADGRGVREKFLEYKAAATRDDARYQNFCNELKYVRRLIAVKRSLRLLDVACGPGAFTEFWIEHGFDASGVDIDPSLLEAAKRRLEARGMTARLAVGRVERLPFGDGSFDVCVANAVLEHIPDWQAMLREITRVLNGGGILVLCTSNRLHPFQREVNNFPFYPWIPARLKTRILAYIMKHRPDLVNYTDLPAVNWFTYEELRAFLEGLGFSVSTRLDMVRRSDLTGWKAALAPVLDLLQRVRVLRYLYYFYADDSSVYAVKKSSTHGYATRVA